MILQGESYAGIYVPGFANALMDDPIPGLNFKVQVPAIFICVTFISDTLLE